MVQYLLSEFKLPYHREITIWSCEKGLTTHTTAQTKPHTVIDSNIPTTLKGSIKPGFKRTFSFSWNHSITKINSDQEVSVWHDKKCGLKVNMVLYTWTLPGLTWCPFSVWGVYLYCVVWIMSRVLWVHVMGVLLR